MKPRFFPPPTGFVISNEISTWPRPGFNRDGRRLFGPGSDDDGVMPLFYRQQLHERVTLRNFAVPGARERRQS
ncbi:MAG: hypothetical protein ACOZE5_14490 [Verrucomicrobiota bacterium]